MLDKANSWHNVLLNKIYSWQRLCWTWHRLCWTKPIPGIVCVGQNLFPAQDMLDKTYAWHNLSWTKLILGIDSVGQNLYLALVMLDKTYHTIFHMGLSCKIGCFLNETIISDSKL